MSMAIITHILRHQQQIRDHFLFDTFRGIDEKYITDEERSQKHYKDLVGIYRENYAEVKEVFKDYSNVHLVRGPVPDTLSSDAARSINGVAFCYIDMNNWVPELAALDFIWPKMNHGGIVMSDDFGVYGLEAQYRMWREFAESKGDQIHWVPGTGQAVIIKQ